MIKRGIATAILAAVLPLAAVRAESPNWTYRGEASTEAKIAAVVRAGKAEAVVIDKGLKRNFRAGAVCAVRKDGTNEIAANVVVVDSDAEKSVALIIDGAEISEGDKVYIRPANLK